MQEANKIRQSAGAAPPSIFKLTPSLTSSQLHNPSFLASLGEGRVCTVSGSKPRSAAVSSPYPNEQPVVPFASPYDDSSDLASFWKRPVLVISGHNPLSAASSPSSNSPSPFEDHPSPVRGIRPAISMSELSSEADFPAYPSGLPSSTGPECYVPWRADISAESLSDLLDSALSCQFDTALPANAAAPSLATLDSPLLSAPGVASPAHQLLPVDVALSSDHSPPTRKDRKRARRAEQKKSKRPEKRRDKKANSQRELSHRPSLHLTLTQLKPIPVVISHELDDPMTASKATQGGYYGKRFVQMAEGPENPPGSSGCPLATPEDQTAPGSFKRAATPADFSGSSLPSAPVNKRHRAGDGDVPPAPSEYVAPSLQSMVERGYQVVPYVAGASGPIEGQNKRIVAVRLQTPTDKGWMEAVEQAGDLLDHLRPSCFFKADEARGKLNAINVGYSYGGGRKHPMNNVVDVRNAEAVEALKNSAAFNRLAGFASAGFCKWAPKLWDHYRVAAAGVEHQFPGLERFFLASVWTSATFNFGPKAVSRPHKDSLNLAWGLCAVTALGRFDFTRGGHLVLEELKLIIELPPGCTILLPSAMITHYNTAIGTDEVRYSMAQYSAGSTFQYADNGMQTKASLKQKDPKKAKAAEGLDRFTPGLEMLSTLEELRQRYSGP